LLSFKNPFFKLIGQWLYVVVASLLKNIIMYQVEKNLDKPAELIKAKQQAQLSRKQLEQQKQQEAKQKQQDKLLRQQQEKQRKQQQQQQQAWMSGLIELLYN
jgi:hypothetical protein